MSQNLVVFCPGFLSVHSQYLLSSGWGVEEGKEEGGRGVRRRGETIGHADTAKEQRELSKESS